LPIAYTGIRGYVRNVRETQTGNSSSGGDGDDDYRKSISLDDFDS
jgi:hypothetical protein